MPRFRWLTAMKETGYARYGSPAAGSTFTTSAPKSASSDAANGAARKVEASSTRIPASGSPACPSGADFHGSSADAPAAHIFPGGPSQRSTSGIAPGDPATPAKMIGDPGMVTGPSAGCSRTTVPALATTGSLRIHSLRVATGAHGTPAFSNRSSQCPQGL